MSPTIRGSLKHCLGAAIGSWPRGFARRRCDDDVRLAPAEPGVPVLEPVTEAASSSVSARSGAGLHTAVSCCGHHASPGSPRRVAGRGLLLLAVLFAAGMAYQRGGLTSLRAGSAAEPILALVVLPFENLTGDPGQDYFVDRVTDAITVHLQQVAGIDVISRTSARQYKNTAKRARRLRQELKVDGVVEGRCEVRAGVGITVHLIRAATERDVWSEPTTTILVM